jgi:hypothetical protein
MEGATPLPKAFGTIADGTGHGDFYEEGDEEEDRREEQEPKGRCQKVEGAFHWGKKE